MLLRLLCWEGYITVAEEKKDLMPLWALSVAAAAWAVAFYFLIPGWASVREGGKSNRSINQHLSVKGPIFCKKPPKRNFFERGAIGGPSVAVLVKHVSLNIRPALQAPPWSQWSTVHRLGAYHSMTSITYQLHQSSSTLPCPPHEVPDSTWCLKSTEMPLAI